MALIDCPECGREVSSRAAACPECAYPVISGSPSLPVSAAGKQPKHQWWKTALAIAARVGIGLMLVGVGLGEEEATGVVGGLIIGGSAIPAWYRARFERSRISRPGHPLDDGIAKRLAEMEQRHRASMVELQALHTGQIADLEERIDFTERVLTRNREQINPG